jgi:DNA-binding NarL/FixJ family response regulator
MAFPIGPVSPQELLALHQAVRQLLESWSVLICSPCQALRHQLLLEPWMRITQPLHLLSVCSTSQEARLWIRDKSAKVIVLSADVLDDGPVLPWMGELQHRPHRPLRLVCLKEPHRVTLQALQGVGVEALISESNLGRGVLLAALTQLSQGQTYVDPSCLELLRNGAGLDELSPRELEILQLVAEGLTNGAIATRLGIAEVTARDHLRHIQQKLHAANRTAAVVQGIHLGYLPWRSALL